MIMIAIYTRYCQNYNKTHTEKNVLFTISYLIMPLKKDYKLLLKNKKLGLQNILFLVLLNSSRPSFL